MLGWDYCLAFLSFVFSLQSIGYQIQSVYFHDDEESVEFYNYRKSLGIEKGKNVWIYMHFLTAILVTKIQMNKSFVTGTTRREA